MIGTSEFRRGVRVELDGEPFEIVEQTMQSASARGSNTTVRVRLRNLRTGQLVERSFRAGERVKQPDFEIRTVQYLYADVGDLHCFMDAETFDQFSLPSEAVARALEYLRPNDSARALFFNGQCIGVEVSPTVVLRVSETQPGFRGDTVTGATKPATLETGAVVEVPLFVEVGEAVVVDTRDGRYLRRA